MFSIIKGESFFIEEKDEYSLFENLYEPLPVEKLNGYSLFSTKTRKSPVLKKQKEQTATYYLVTFFLQGKQYRLGSPRNMEKYEEYGRNEGVILC